MTATTMRSRDVVAAGGDVGVGRRVTACGPAATTPTVDPAVSSLDMSLWDGYERGACPSCPHPSIRLIGNRGVVDNHWRMASWRKPVAHHYRPALVATTARCDGAGQPPKRDPWVVEQ